jgi:polar amino acid transport system substrate-binding protein
MRWMIVLLAAALFPWQARAEGLRLVTAELPPYTFHEPPPTVSEIGQPMGIVQEVVAEMARRVHQPPDIEYLAWTRAQELAMTGKNVGILSLTRTPERESHYKWVQQILVDDLVLIGGTGIDVSALDAAKNRPTGVLLHSGAEDLLRQSGFTRIEPAGEEWVNAQKMKDRRIDAWLAPRLMAIYAYKQVGGDAAVLNLGTIVRPSEIYFATSPDVSDAVAKQWQDAFKSMQADGTYMKIVAKYRTLKVEPVPASARHGDEALWVN